MGDVHTARNVVTDDLRSATEVVAPVYDVAALGDGAMPGNNDLAGVIMTQYSLNKGIDVFGEKGVEAVRNEMQQIHDREVLRPKDTSKMSRTEKSKALKYLMFLKEKQDWTIKARGCADGRKQRKMIDKEAASSPTISTEGLLLVATIAAEENRRVSVVDVPGACLQTDLKGEEVVVMFEG